MEEGQNSAKTDGSGLGGVVGEDSEYRRVAEEIV